MFKIEIASSGEEQISSYLYDLEYRVVDLRPLALEIAELIEIDNMAARMQGVDKDDQEFAPLAPETWRRRLGDGPPLAPMDMASRIISGIELSLADTGIGGVDVIASWPSMPFLRFHVTGTRHMPARDPVGIRPHGWSQIEAALDRFGESAVKPNG